MTGAKRLKIVIISAIVLAVLLIAACFSVSYAKWEGGGASNQATVDGSVGQFYVDVPAQDALPDLDEDTYYFKVDSKSSDPRFYPLSEPYTNGAGSSECTLTVELTAGDVITAYKGKTVVSDLSRDWAHGDGEINEITTIENGSFKAKQSTIYRFYYKLGFNAGKDALFVGCGADLSFTFKGGKTIHAFVTNSDTNTSHTPYLWLWVDGGPNYTGGEWPGYKFSDISSGAKSINVSGLEYESNNLKFIVSYYNGNYKVTESPTYTFDEYFNSSIVNISISKTEVKSTPVVSTPKVASTDGSDDVIVRKVSASANADNSYTYKNYVCVKRDYIDDITVAYVNFSVSQIGSVNPANVKVTNFTVNRTTADASGNLTGASDSEFVYNSPVGYSLASMNGVKQTKNGRTYIEGGTYLMLYFGENGNQYYALDVTITTEAAVDFELIARVADEDRRNAFVEGCGEAYGYYLGGVFSGVDMWDPRAAALLTKNGDYSETSEELKYMDGDVLKTYYGPSSIDVTLTIDLREKFDRVKLYRLDETGTRQGGEPTLYFVPKNIQKSYKSEAEEGKVVYDEQLNTIVLSPGKYELHFFGNVTYKSNSDCWFNRSTGELGGFDGGGTVTDIEGNPGPQYVTMDNWNGVVENLFIKRLDDEDDEIIEVTFDANGGTLAGEEKVKASVNWGEKLLKPTDPINGNMTFVAWYTDEALTKEFDFDAPVTAITDFTLYAKWVDETVVKYTVTFHNNYTGAANDVFRTIDNVVDGSTINKPSTDPSRTGYKFDGWYKDAECTDEWVFATQAVTEDTKDLYAKWTPNKYTVKFDLNGLPNTTVSDAEVDYDTAVAAPTVVLPEHYTIDGWYTDATCTTAYDFSTKITAGRTLYAKWHADNGVYYGGVYAQGLEKNTDNDDGTEYMSLGVPQTNDEDAVVTFWYDGIERGSEIKPSCPLKPATGSVIKLAKGAYNFYYKFNSNDNGLWIALSHYIIDFDANEGAFADDETYVRTNPVDNSGKGTLTTFIADPTKDGYRFDGWYTAASGGNKVTATSNNSFSANTTLYAHWVKQYIVTFNATAGSSWSDGSIKHEIKVDENATVAAEGAPQTAPEGKMFDCWSESNTTSGGAAFVFTSPITADVTLYAQWKDKPANAVIVTFYYNYEEAPESGVFTTTTVEVGTGISAPSENPTRDGYRFIGWAASETSTSVITSFPTATGDVDYYAHWRPELGEMDICLVFTDGYVVLDCSVWRVNDRPSVIKINGSSKTPIYKGDMELNMSISAVNTIEMGNGNWNSWTTQLNVSLESGARYTIKWEEFNKVSGGSSGDDPVLDNMDIRLVFTNGYIILDCDATSGWTTGNRPAEIKINGTSYTPAWGGDINLDMNMSAVSTIEMGNVGNSWTSSLNISSQVGSLVSGGRYSIKWQEFKQIS